MNIVNQQLPQRRSIRLPDYDYSTHGYYFVTICTQDRQEMFGEINDGKMVLNDMGKMIEDWWKKIPGRFDSIALDQHQIMPNHMHGIVIIDDSVTYASVGVDPRVDPSMEMNPIGRTHRSAPTLGNTIQWFKTMSTNEYIRNVKTHGWQSFNKRLWQRNYYEHVIRNDQSLQEIREYIINNPANWEKDKENPENFKITP